MTASTILSDISTIVDCEHKTAPLVEEGIPSIRTPNIGKGRLLLSGVNRVDEKTYRLWTKRAMPEQGDLILAREAPVGNVALIPKNLKVCLGQRTVLIKPKHASICSEYLNYLLNSNAVNEHLINISNGVTVGHLNVTDIRKLKLPHLPNLPIQRKIAAVLSAYDDLIENNNRRIAILEKMAEEIYREWFVRLRFPGHEKVRIVKGVPEGWEIMRIGDLVEHQIGGGWGQETPSGSENMPVYIIRGTDFKAIEKGNFTTAPLRFEKQSSIISRALKHGDIILENSVNAQSRCTGNTILITEQILKQFDHPVMPASFCKLIRFKDVNLAFYIWKHMRCYYEQGAMEYFQNVATNGIANFQMARFLERFIVKIPLDINLANSLWSFDCSKHKAILQTLTISRDMLLSRLMSGKIDVERLDIKFPASMMEESVNA